MTLHNSNDTVFKKNGRHIVINQQLIQLFHPISLECNHSLVAEINVTSSVSFVHSKGSNRLGERYATMDSK
jgi:hypothetical protein